MEFFYSQLTGFSHVTFLKYRLRYRYFPKNFFNSFRHISEHLGTANSICYRKSPNYASNIKRI